MLNMQTAGHATAAAEEGADGAHSKTVGRLLAGPISPIDVETMRCCGKRAFTAFRAGLATKLTCAGSPWALNYQRGGH